MDFRGLVCKRVWKINFFLSEIGSGFGEPGGTPTPRIPMSNPPEVSSGSEIYLSETGFTTVSTN